MDEWLLNQVSKHVRYEKLGPFSKDLGISETEYQKIAVSNIDRQIFKVKRWIQCKWLIEGFPKGAINHQQGVGKLFLGIIFAENCVKMEIN